MKINEGKNDILKVKEYFDDYISDLVLLKGSQKIAVTCWDGSFSILDYENRDNVCLKLRLNYDHGFLCCCEYFDEFSGSKLYVGTVMGQVLRVDLATQQFIEVVGLTNTKAISCISTLSSGKVVCGSWDGVLQVINCETNKVVSSMTLKNNYKIFGMDSNNDKLVVYTNSNKIFCFDIPLTTSSIGQEVDSGLRYQTRDLKLSPAGDCYATSSVDGRVAIEYFNNDSKKFAFRCHRLNLNDSQFVFPVNSLCFAPRSSILYTGGSDGCVSCWNLITRKKMEQLPKFNENSVVKIACNTEILCVATSDDDFKTNPTLNEEYQEKKSDLYIVNL